MQKLLELPEASALYDRFGRGAVTLALRAELADTTREGVVR